jgi:hypothetical protein
VTIRNLPIGKVETILSASIIAKHFAANEDAVGERLLEKEM